MRKILIPTAVFVFFVALSIYGAWGLAHPDVKIYPFHLVSISADGNYIATQFPPDWDYTPGMSIYDAKFGLFNRNNNIPEWSHVPSDEGTLWEFPPSINSGMSRPDISISSDGSYIVFATEWAIHLYSKTSETPLWVWRRTQGCSGPFVSVDISSGGEFIAAGIENYVYLFTKTDNIPVWAYTLNNEYVYSVSTSDNGDYIAVCSSSGVYLFAYGDNTPAFWYAFDGGFSVSMSSDGEYIVAASSGIWPNYSGAGIYLFSRADNALVWSYPVEDVASVSISSDGSYIAAITSNTIHLFARTGSDPIWSYTVGTNKQFADVRCLVALSSNGSRVVAGASDGIYLFASTNNAPLWVYSATEVDSVSISSDGSYIAAGSGKELSVFSSASSTPLWTYEYPTGITLHWQDTTGPTLWWVSVASLFSALAAGFVVLACKCGPTIRGSLVALFTFFLLIAICCWIQAWVVANTVYIY